VATTLAPATGHKFRAEQAHNYSFESFSGRLRDELLNETRFTSLVQTRAVLAAWKDDCNNVRPHSALANLTPNLSIAVLADHNGALRYAGGSTPRPVASPSPLGPNVTETILLADEGWGSGQIGRRKSLGHVTMGPRFGRRRSGERWWYRPLRPLEMAAAGQTSMPAMGALRFPTCD
jgi:hypothetical protein